jgi:hypothetical protein
MSVGADGVKLWSKDYEITQTTNASIQQITANYTENVQQCSSNYVSSGFLSLNGCEINGDINLDSNTVATSNCIFSSTTAVATTNTAYQDATNSSSLQVANAGCSAKAGGASIALLANAGAASVDCSLPQDTTVKMTNTINLQVLMLTVTSTVYSQQCSNVFTSSQELQCSDSVVNGDINFTQSMDASTECNMTTNTTVDTYNDATQYASNSATASEEEHTGSGIGILAFFLLLIIIIVAASCSQGQNKSDEEQIQQKGVEAQKQLMEDYYERHPEKRPASTSPMTAGGEEGAETRERVDNRKLRKDVTDMVPIISSVVFGIAIINVVVFLCCYLFVLPVMPDPYASPTELEEFTTAGKAWLFVSVLLGAGGLSALIAESLMLDDPKYGLAWHVHDLRLREAADSRSSASAPVA